MKTMKNRNLKVLRWVACLPDLNPIDNLWEIIVRGVFHGSRQFETIAAVKDRIQEIWDGIDVDMLKNLSCFLPNRVADVIRMGAHQTKY